MSTGWECESRNAEREGSSDTDRSRMTPVSLEAASGEVKQSGPIRALFG